MLSLGIDIGGSFIKYAWINENSEIIKDWEIETKLCPDVDAFYDYVCAHVGELENINCIGVSAPGVISKASDVTSIAAPNVEIMFGHNVNEMITKRLNLPCYTMNDAKAAAHCELKLGAARGSQSSMVFIIGTGIGGALMSCNHVLDGVDGYAGEFSRIPMRDRKGNFGVGAMFASATTLPKLYNQMHPGSVKNAKDVFDLYHQKNVDAISAMAEWVDNIAFLLASLITIYNPEVICIGGGVTKDPGLIAEINDTFDRNYRGIVFAQPELTTKIVLCKYASQANLIGAVLFANEKHKLI